MRWITQKLQALRTAIARRLVTAYGLTLVHTDSLDKAEKEVDGLNRYARQSGQLRHRTKAGQRVSAHSADALDFLAAARRRAARVSA